MKYCKQVGFLSLIGGVFLAVSATAAPDPTQDKDADKAPPAKRAPVHSVEKTRPTPGNRRPTTDLDGEPRKSSTHSTTSSDSLNERHKSSTTSTPGETSTHQDSTISHPAESSHLPKTSSEKTTSTPTENTTGHAAKEGATTSTSGETTIHHESTISHPAESTHAPKGSIEKKTMTTTETTTEKSTGHGGKEVTKRETTTTTKSAVHLQVKKTPDGGHEKVTPSGQVREREVVKVDGTHTQKIAPTGRVTTEVIVRKDGAHETQHFGPTGQVQKTEVVVKGGGREVTAFHYGRDGHERVNETVVVDVRGREVSKTVVIKERTIIVNNPRYVVVEPYERHYDRYRFGFVYRPIFEIHSPVFVSWYDPYWYSPVGVVIVHPFHYSWGWDVQPWYHHHHHYFATYEVYPTPSYWVTDWMIAGYAADHYAAAVSVDQARAEAQAAREDAAKAQAAAAQAQEQAEIAEAHAAQQAAEARAARAEAKIAQLQAAEAQAKLDKPSANLAPIDPQTKEQLRLQVEQTVAEKKAYAEQAASGAKPVPPDVSTALADPKHVYPISSSINVISAADQSPAGTLSEGDLLKLEPGQEEVIKTADENTFIKMRVLTSKGEDGEAQAGSVVSIPLKTVQDSDSEFRAKLDLGLAEADKNKDQFKGGAQ